MKKMMAVAVVILFAAAVVFVSTAVATITPPRGATIGVKEEIRNYLENIEKSSPEVVSMSEMVKTANRPKVVIVGGWNPRDRELMKPLLEGIPGSVGIVPNRMIPLGTAAKELLRQIREDERITGKIILVAASFAGLVVRKLDADNPGVVTAIITIGTGNNFGFGSVPLFIQDLLFSTGDEKSTTPLYVIAGYDDSPSRFYMKKGEPNDGLVAVEDVLCLGKRKVSDQRVLRGYGHFELFKSAEVIRLVKRWVQMYLDDIQLLEFVK